MSKYEYVQRNEYQPVREELEAIIKKVQRILKKNKTGITFRFELIGSGSRHLITRIKDGNKGFDFDYNLVVNWHNGKMWTAEYARSEISNAFKEAVKGTGFTNPKNTKVVLRIKKKDNHMSKILYSCDFAVVYYRNELSDGYECAKLDLKTGKYKWEMRRETVNYPDKLLWLRDNIKSYWDEIKDEYLLLKDNNKDPDKRSYHLFYEAVNNVYNHN